MIIACAGHRKVATTTKEHVRLLDLAIASLDKYKPEMVISGMALGWDRMIAEAAIELKIPFEAAVPFHGQESEWHKKAQMRYNELLELASHVEYVCSPGYAPGKYEVRNMWMVDNSDMILALWNGKPGGTAGCIEYAEQVEKPVINLWNSWIKYK